MKEVKAREMLEELFERHCVPSIPIIFHPRPITTKMDISKKLEDAGLGHMADSVTATTTIYGAFMTNPITGEKGIEFYGLPSATIVRHEFKHYLDHLEVKYIRKSPTRKRRADGKCPECGLPATHPSGLCRDCHQAKLEAEEERAHELHEWAHSNGGKSLSELQDEARRRWPDLTSLRISQIIVFALEKEAED